MRVAAFRHHMRLVDGLAVTEDGSTGPIRVELAPVTDGERPHLEVAGIGVQLRATHEGRMRVATVLPESGAAAAGLAPGDLLLGVDGREIAGLPLERVLDLVRGPEGTNVRLLVRKADGRAVELMVRRALIRT